ncbi:MAG TPA: S53 family peptidase [Ktedonosporobacter sp.]|nr:S53 family peptidase [Ktedonosporobacter sp.]
MKRYVYSITFVLAILLLCTGTFLGIAPGHAQQPTHSLASLLQPFYTGSSSSHTVGKRTAPSLQSRSCQFTDGKHVACEGLDGQTPLSMRTAFGLEPLIRQGFTGKGQTVVVIDSFGSPTLQKDLDTFSAMYGLPKTTLKITTLPSLPLPHFDTTNGDMMGWAGETTLDVETIHAIAPDANIVVLLSPVSETEGVAGFPEFLQLEQYAVDKKLGSIFSQSYGASELTLTDPKGQALIKQYSDFYRKITLDNHITVLTASGDHGATDVLDVNENLAHVRAVSFPDDVPWVTAVGGISLYPDQPPAAWEGSGGGISSFFTEPDYQRMLPTALQASLHGKRGLPDVAANADPGTAMPIYFNGSWQLIGGTSASTPQWAAIIAIANQMAGRPLGFINPALYKLGNSPNAREYFTAITSGDNDNLQAGVTGYQAGPGWNLVTGWGMPNAAKLLPALIDATPK